MNVVALIQRKRLAKEKMRRWHTSASRWYSSNSNRTQSTVAPPSTPAVNFLFLHRKKSATVDASIHTCITRTTQRNITRRF